MTPRSPRTTSLSKFVPVLIAAAIVFLLAVLLAGAVLATPAPAPAVAPASAAAVAKAPAPGRPIEPFASYQPQKYCSPSPKPGMVVLAHWMVKTYGGSFGGISRACSSAISEHEEGRAFDWTLDARSKADRHRARAFLHDVRATDAAGHPDARARRMGIMYVIWNDQMWPAWNHFRPEPYLASSCKTVQKCSPVLRHRTHLHVSLTRAGGKGLTSWYAGRLG